MGGAFFRNSLRPESGPLKQVEQYACMNIACYFVYELHSFFLCFFSLGI